MVNGDIKKSTRRQGSMRGELGMGGGGLEPGNQPNTFCIDVGGLQ